MENNEIMINEEVMEDVAEVATVDSGKGFKTVAAIGLTVLAGLAIYKVGKKIVAKVKAKKEQTNEVEAEYEELVEDDCNSKEAV